ncbi:MAG: hypothetical protein QM756_24805 [Polyangiaceae bacterium]
MITRCLAKSREQRFPNVAELSVALLPFAPRRDRVLVERIAGIFQVAGLTSSALALPASEHGESLPAVHSPGTVSPWSRSSVRRGNTKAVVGSVTLFTVLALVGAFFLLRRATSAEPAAPAAASAVESFESPPALLPPPAPSSTEPAPVVAEVVPAEAASVAAPEVEPATLPSGAKPKPLLHAPPVNPAPRAATAKPECDPPYTLDDQGRKKFKPECFLKPKK